MSMWDRAAAQPAAVHALRGAAADGRVAHAWLMVGPPGVGQRALTTAMLAALNCDAPPVPGEPCETCTQCDQVARGVHVDLHTFAPEGAAHRVGDVRGTWVPTASRKPGFGRYQLLSVTHADRMNEQAQNALLKGLEEPPPSTIWMLHAEDDQALLDTIVSRCRRVDVRPWRSADLLAALPSARQRRHDAILAEQQRRDVAGWSPKKRESTPLPEPLVDGNPERDAVLARIVDGSPDRLEEVAAAGAWDGLVQVAGVPARLLTDPSPGVAVREAATIMAWADSRAAAVRALHAVEETDAGVRYGVLEPDGSKIRGSEWPPGMLKRMRDRFKREETAAKRRAHDLAVTVLSVTLRDAAAHAAQGAPVGMVDPTLVEPVSVAFGVSPALEAAAAVEACRADLRWGVQPRLVWESVLLSLASRAWAVSRA